MTRPRLSWLRVAIVAALALVAAFQAVRFAAVETLLQDRPQSAARIWPGHPQVALATSMAAIGTSAARGKAPDARTIAAAMDAARRAPLAEEPFLIKGALATAAGEAAQAERLFVEARRRDPRSAAARFFLAQHYLATGRPLEGLADAAVLGRLVPGADAALIPGLVQYARAPGAIPNLKRMFAGDPRLGDAVLAVLARDSDNVGLVLALGGDSLGRAGPQGVPAWQTAMLQALVARGELGKAHALWLRIAGVKGSGEGIFNSQFASLQAPPPFNWALSSGDFGVAEPVAPGGLQIIYYGRANAEFASQLLLLAPGSYELRMQVTRDGAAEEPSGLAWSLACQPGGRSLLALPVAGEPGAARPLAARFTVPADCPAQLLRLTGTAREFAASEQAVISNLQLIGNAR